MDESTVKFFRTPLDNLKQSWLGDQLLTLLCCEIWLTKELTQHFWKDKEKCRSDT